MKKIQVKVVYALTDHQFIYSLNITFGSTVKEAIKYSNILNKFTEINLYKNKIGIYNKIVNINIKIKDGDRIEIYRPLIIDPKERRRKKIFSLNKNIF